MIEKIRQQSYFLLKEYPRAPLHWPALLQLEVTQLVLAYWNISSSFQAKPSEAIQSLLVLAFPSQKTMETL